MALFEVNLSATEAYTFVVVAGSLEEAVGSIEDVYRAQRAAHRLWHYSDAELTDDDRVVVEVVNVDETLNATNTVDTKGQAD